MSDQIRRLSEELARDPSSMVFLELGEQLRRRCELDVAQRIAIRGLERHPEDAEAHDLLARISLDQGDLERAFDEWDMVLRLTPDHVAARKGMGYVLFKQGRLAEAEHHLNVASGLDSSDETIARALAIVRRKLAPLDADRGEDAASGDHPSVADASITRVEDEFPTHAPPDSLDARMLFADVLGQGEHTALLMDRDGLVMAGLYVTAAGEDVSHEIGAALSAIQEEAERVTAHVNLGEWQAVVVEAETSIIALAPAPEGATVMLAAVETMPLGYVSRTLQRCRARAVRWLEEGT